MITIIVSSFKELNRFINRAKPLKHYSTETLDIKYIEHDSTNLTIIKSGVGIKNARIASNYAVNNLKSRKIYIAGVCGALDSGLKIGDIVVGQWVYSLEKARKISLCKLNNSVFNKISSGGILTHNKFVNTSTQKHTLHQNTQAIVVDMETWGAAEVCEKSGTELYALRSVSDLKTDNLPDLGYIFNSKSKLDLSRSLKYFSKNPYLFYKFIEFKYFNLKVATDKLSCFLEDIFSSRQIDNR